MSRAETIETFRRLFDEKSPPMCPNCSRPLKRVILEKVKMESVVWSKGARKYFPIESMENYELIKVLCESCGKKIKDDTAKIVWSKVALKEERDLWEQELQKKWRT